MRKRLRDLSGVGQSVGVDGSGIRAAPESDPASAVFELYPSADRKEFPELGDYRKPCPAPAPTRSLSRRAGARRWS